MKKWLSCICAVFLTVGAAAVPLFENGKTQWQIILPENPAAGIKYAAEELAAALKKISGANFEIKSPYP